MSCQQIGLMPSGFGGCMEFQTEALSFLDLQGEKPDHRTTSIKKHFAAARETWQ